MLEWLIPIGLFWIVAAIYLGGYPLEFENGSGPREILGLLLTLVLFVGVWAGLRAALGSVGGFIGRVAIPTLVVAIGFGWLARVAFRVTGVTIRRTGSATH